MYTGCVLQPISMSETVFDRQRVGAWTFVFKSSFLIQNSSFLMQNSPFSMQIATSRDPWLISELGKVPDKNDEICI